MIRWNILLVILSIAMTGNAQAQTTCTNSADDEIIVEYFNEITFNEDIYIVKTDLGTQYTLQLNCPSQETPSFPPSDFYLAMTPSDPNSPPSLTSCASGIISLDKILLQSKKYISCEDGENCIFKILLKNKASGTQYCETLYQITFVNGNETLIPNLNPATIPICNNTISNCILDNTCSLNSGKSGEVSLCDSASSCLSEPNSESNAYNEKPAGLL